MEMVYNGYKQAICIHCLIIQMVIEERGVCDELYGQNDAI